jgi:acyl carrier protein
VNVKLSGLDWIKAVRQMLVQAYANQDVPFEMLAHELELNRQGAPTRLYQVMFSFQDARQRQTHWGPLAHERIAAFQKGSTEDINLWMVEIPGGIEGGVQYNAEVFLPETATALRDRFLTVLDELARNPTHSVAQLLAARPEELVRVNEWMYAAQPSAPAHDVLDAIAASINRWPDAPAMAHGTRHVSYAELGRRLADAERAVQRASAGARGPVAVCTSDPLVQVAASLAVLKLGRPCLALDSSAPAHVLRKALNESNASLFVGDAGMRSLAPSTPWLDALELGAQVAAAGVVGAEAFRDGDASQQPIDRHQASAAIASLRREFALTNGQTVLTVREPRRGSSLIDALLALSVGARWLVCESQDPSPLLTVMREQHVTYLGASARAWAQLLAENGRTPLSVMAPLDVREIATPLARQLLDTGCRVFSLLHVQHLGVAVAGGWLSGLADVGLFGRPLFDRTTGPAVLVIDAQGTPVAAGLPGVLAIQHANGRAQETGIACRWRSDGVLQYLDAPEVHAVAVKADGAAAKGQGDTADLTPTEQALVDVWSTLLGMQGVSRADNFFELGGTSLMAMQAVGLLEQRLGRSISPRRYVFDSLGQLAAAYDESGATQPAAPASTGPTAAPSPAPRGLMKRLAGLVGRS